MLVDSLAHRVTHALVHVMHRQAGTHQRRMDQSTEAERRRPERALEAAAPGCSARLVTRP